MKFAKAFLGEANFTEANIKDIFFGELEYLEVAESPILDIVTRTRDGDDFIVATTGNKIYVWKKRDHEWTGGNFYFPGYTIR